MRKKMIEVAIPLDVINEEAARRKRKAPAGYPTQIHKWWAQRPIAACRAVLFASLVDDPDSDPSNKLPDGTVDQPKAQSRRKHLFQLLGDLVKWENSDNETLLARARAEIASSVASVKLYDVGEWTASDIVCGDAVQAFIARTASDANVREFLAKHAPPVIDPFCGGGSIPLEAHRLGVRVLASDLNPVPVLINKGLVEIPSRFANRPPVHPQANADRKSKLAVRQWKGATGIAEDVRKYGQLVRDEAAKRIGHLYPDVKVTPKLAANRPDLASYEGESLAPVAWLWSRAVRCPNPSCSARTPLMRTFWLSTKPGKKVYAKPVIDHKKKTVRFDICTEGEPPKHTTDRMGARCLFCDHFIKKPELRELACSYGMSILPVAVVCEGLKSRLYLPFDGHVPDLPSVDVSFLEQAMTDDKRWFSPPQYGLPRFYDLFTDRQRLCLLTFSELIEEVVHVVEKDAKAAGFDDASEYSNAVAVYLAFSLSRAADYNSSLASWRPKDNAMRSTLPKQAIPMVWDFAEANPLASSSSGFADCSAVVSSCLSVSPAEAADVAVEQRDATHLDPPVKGMVCTDPPYYDNIGYSDLSDFFYLWLRKTCASLFPSLFATVVTPKTDELIATPYRHGGDKQAATHFFEVGLGHAFEKMRQAEDVHYPTTVFYAFKQSETDDDEDDDSTAHGGTVSTGWETMLEGLVHAGYVITGTWPMRTEGDNRQVGNQANALASSIVLVCRPRSNDAPLSSRRDFVATLKRELPQSLHDLQLGNIAPVDLAQAAIGPGMAIYSRYAKVVESSGERLTVRTALALINQVLDEVLAEQEGDYDADTRWSLKWFEQFAHEDGPFGDANTLATAMSIGINGLVETGIVQAKAGKVRLLRRTELMSGHPETWDPATDTDIVHWEVCQYLIHALDTKGEAGAAALLRRINARYPGAAETARELAYRLYTICERKKWAQEAMAYNSLIVAWPEIVKLAQSTDGSGGEAQTTMF